MNFSAASATSGCKAVEPEADTLPSIASPGAWEVSDEGDPGAVEVEGLAPLSVVPQPASTPAINTNEAANFNPFFHIYDKSPSDILYVLYLTPSLYQAFVNQKAAVY
jgi:hypothetical protein